MRASFNEAGAIEPRKPRGVTGSNRTTSSFNEAGAIEPRKRWPAAVLRRLHDSFNEAGAIEPRKPAWCNEVSLERNNLQ